MTPSERGPPIPRWNDDGNTRDVLAGARTCFLSVGAPRGPHVTPHAFAISGGRLWFTTSRDARKVRALRKDGRVSALITEGDRAVLIGGTVKILEAVNPFSIVGAPLDALRTPRALVRLSMRTLEEAVGYALSAMELPLAWLPPNRVLLSLRPHSRIVLDGHDGVLDRWGRWAQHGEPPSLVDRVRGVRAVSPPHSGLEGFHTGALAWDTAHGPVTVPAVLDGDRGIARIPRTVVRYLETAEAPAAFAAHGAEGIKPTDKHGVLVRGIGYIVGLGEQYASVSIDAASRTRWHGFTSDTTILRRRAG